MAETKTLGAAIDDIISALEALEPKARVTAINAACAHLGITPVFKDVMPQGADSSQKGLVDKTLTPVGPTTSTTVMDIRTLKNEKAPRSAQEMACVVAYYLQELAPSAERKSTVTVADIEKYFKQASFKLPKTIRQLLVDAKASGYFDSAGAGAYQLNAVGYNLVAHTLPRTK